MPLLDVDIDESLNRCCHRSLWYRRADDIAERRIVAPEPPIVIWYHSSPFLSTPRMPMWPTWWWPQAFMQPDMLSSISPMS